MRAWEIVRSGFFRLINMLLWGKYFILYITNDLRIWALPHAGPEESTLASPMTRSVNRGSRLVVRTFVLFCLLLPGLLLAASSSGAAEQTIGPLPSGTQQTLVPPPAGIRAFHPGETLTYDVSWSGVFSAGTVTMTVESEMLPEEREVLKFVVRGRTQGLVNRVYPVDDTVQSVFDPLLMQSVTYILRESYGKKRRLRVTEFDHARRTAVCRLNEDPPKTLAIPEGVQDGLSLLYFLRTREDLPTGRRLDIDVVDSGKHWTVEVAVLSREKAATAAGEFDTIKIRTSPKDKGVLTGKGVVLLWLTDDDRKVPVRMKSTLKVGSFLFELTDMKPGIPRLTR